MSARVPPLRALDGLMWLAFEPYSRRERITLGVVGFIGLIGIWEAAVQTGLLSRALLSSPSRIWGVAVQDFYSGIIWSHIFTSLSEFGVGFMAALVLGIPIGLMIGWFRRADHLLSGLLAGMNATPNIALIPLIVLIFGIGFESKVVVVFLSAFFAVMITTYTGIRSIARRHLDITRSFGGSAWLAFRTVAIPSTVPFMISGTRIGAGRALVGVVSAEILAAVAGLGLYINRSATFLDISRVMLGILLFGLIGLVFGEVLRAVEKRFDKWRPEVS